MSIQLKKTENLEELTNIKSSEAGQEKNKTTAVSVSEDSIMPTPSDGLNASLIFSLWMEAMKIGITYSCTPAYTLIGLMMMNFVGDTEVQAAFGLVGTFFSLFFYSLIVPLQDKAGIEISRFIGEGDFKKVRKVFLQCLVASLLFVVFITAPIFFTSDKILNSIQLPSNVVDRAKPVLQILIISCFAKAVNLPIQTLCFSQNIEQDYASGYAVSLLLASVSSYLLVFKAGLGVYGWLLGSMIFDLVTFALNLKILLNDADPRSWGKVSFEEFRSDFFSFCFSSLQFSLSSYTEFIGYEVTYYFIYRNPNTEETAAVVIMLNMSIFTFCFSESLATVFRTKLNALIGMRKFKQARRFFVLFCASTGLLSLVYSLAVFLLRPFLTYILASSTPSLKLNFGLISNAYCFFCIIELMLLTATMVPKSLGKVAMVTALNVLLLVLVNSALNYLITAVLHLKVIVNLISMYSIMALIAVICLSYGLKASWRPETTEENSENELLVE